MFSVLYLSAGPTEKPSERFVCQSRGDMRFPGSCAKNDLPRYVDCYPDCLLGEAALVCESESEVGGTYEEV